MSFSKDESGKIEYVQKKWTSYVTIYKKINSKGIKDRIVKSKTIKFLK